MGQSKLGWWVAAAAAVFVLMSIGYGMGRRSVTGPNPSSAVTPAGAPLPVIQIEPIQPAQEIAAITAAPGPSMTLETPSATPMEIASASATSSQPLLEDSAQVRQIQQALKAAGFDPGTIDGRMGQRTRTAVRDFQVAQGLEPDGKVGPRTWSKLESFLKQESSN